MKSKKRTRLAVIIAAVLLIAVASAAIALGVGSGDTITFDFRSATSAELQSGTTGNHIQITQSSPDNSTLERVCDFFDGNAFTREKSSKDHTGWGYRLKFYEGDNLLADIVLMDDSRIDYNGYFWIAEHGQAPISWLAELLKEQP
jgi:hypothetical protein